MNTADLRSLADRAEGIQGRQPARLREVQDRIRHRRRRRRTAAVVGAAALGVVVVASTAVIIRPDTGRTTPTPITTPSLPTPTPIPTPGQTTTLVRPLTYAVGQTIHYGDRVIDTGQKVAAVDITDAGVVYLTRDGELWVTDGLSKQQIDPGTGSYNEGYEVVSGAVGSRVAWVRSNGKVPVELVVYDVATRQEVFNKPAGASVWPDFDTTRPIGQALVITAEQVVIHYGDNRYDSQGLGDYRFVSYDLHTGRRTEIDDVRSIAVAPPARVLTYRARSGEAGPLVRTTDSHRLRDGLLITEFTNDADPVWRVADPVDPVTGALLRIPAPAGLPDGTELRLFQWLDDGVFALVQVKPGPLNTKQGALVVCTLSQPRCAIAEAGPASWILPGREFYE